MLTMSFSSFLHGLQTQFNLRRANHGHADRRLRFETFEDRRMLSFTPAATFDTGGGGSFDVVTAHFNNDDYLDLATANYYSGTVSVLLGDGQGGFGDATLYDVGTNPLSVAVGDFNEDGKLDLATANQGDYTYSPDALPSVGVLLGNGDGTFEPVNSLPSYGNALSVAVGDFNADGKLDLGVGSSAYGFLGYYGWASVHAGDGEGNFAEPKPSQFSLGRFESATAADLNGDGADDLVIGDDTRRTVHVFLGGDESGVLQPSAVLSTSGIVQDVAVGDLNGDGIADIVTGSYYGVSVLLSDGVGGYGAEQTYAAGNWSISVVLGDFTGDGHLDIAYDGIGVTNLLRNNGNGTFSDPEGFPVLDDPTLAAGDFNGDGWLDIVALSSSTTVSVYLNNGDWGNVDPNPLPGDYNGNGTVDAADFTVWRDSLGRSGLVPYSGADGSGNGMVGPEDYDVWKSHFGQALPPSGNGSVSVATASAALAAPSDESAVAVAQSNESTVAGTALSSSASKPRQTAQRRRHSDGEQAASPRENPPPVLAPAYSPVTSYRPTPRRSVGAQHALVGSRRDEALMAWLAAQPGPKKRFEDSSDAAVTASKDARRAIDVHRDTVEQVFALLSRI
jgi:hypothetical protein